MSTSPVMHHVIYAIAPERLEASAAFFTELGFALTAFELDDVGLAVRLDWARGVELVSPLETPEGQKSAVAEFLAARGDGIFSAALRVDDIAGAEEIAARYGALTRFRQHRVGDGFELDESDLTILGLPVTLLQTNLP